WPRSALRTGGRCRASSPPSRSTRRRPENVAPPAPDRRRAMAAEPLHYLSIAQLAGRYRQKELSPVEGAQATPDRLGRVDGRLNAYVTVTAERALADARAAEAALRRGGEQSPLLGVPVAYKDLYATRGIRTTAGSALLADWVPDADCTCVARLQDAGAV